MGGARRSGKVDIRQRREQEGKEVGGGQGLQEEGDENGERK